ncbi:hypothetical protein JOF53_005860 [Crossiella equi]|uniref:Uncharacterized protein n=1 Tax=Crossiella equi TaxID=130796 RepID=A0ABS5AK86_9PSEU|nr:hypothetical protein [Crossiella equi]MBP2476988.1 hypothetical protein [Crossiella equi]
MARAVASIASPTWVDQTCFTLHDARGPAGEALPAPREPALVHEDLGHVVFRSAASGHYADVRVELWDGEPGGPGTGFEARGGLDLLLGAAELALGPCASVLRPARLRLPAAGRYRLDAVSSGRAEVRALGDGSHAHGIESWLVRIWPVQAS